jgi:hypothetical protein
MFWDALVWGIGVSLGSTVGLTAFMFAFAAAKRWSVSGPEEQNATERSIAALTRRNQIGEERNEISAEMTDVLRRMAAAAEKKHD